MPSLVIESDNKKNLQLLAKLAKQLGDKAKIVSAKSVKTQSLTTEEAHLVSAFKQVDLLKSDLLKTIDAREFLNDLR
ncbi:MAG: hypothetical protein EOP43_04735 [Sphingobacteriaceae bacterium]|nr:MAG: hypothetical protein EOP43_04735 [Sphingobacteriaceae bacterium]